MNREKFLELVAQIPEIERQFETENIAGVYTVQTIYRNDAFKLWQRGLEYQLKDFYDDIFVKTTFNQLFKINGEQDESDFQILAASLKP